MKNAFILTVLLTAQLSFCQTQEDRYNSKTDKVEVSPEAYIDYSIIASEWERLRLAVVRQEMVIRQREQTIRELSELAKSRLDRINQLTRVVVEKNKNIDNLSEEQIELASNLFSKFSMNAEVDTDLTYLQDFRVRARLSYDLKKVYIFTAGTVGNQYSDIRAGLGLKIF